MYPQTDEVPVKISKMLFSALMMALPWMAPHARDVDDSQKASYAAMTASDATVSTVRSHISGLFFGGTSFYRLSQTPAGDKAASWDEGEISYSITPTFVSVNNQLDPLHNKGTVGVMVLGVEHFDEIDTVTGITVSLDILRVTSTEISSSGAAPVDTSVSGSGLTIAPYVAKQLESGWLADASIGVGGITLETNTSGTTGKPRSSRMFASGGLTKVQGLADDTILMTTKLAVSYSSDSVKTFTLSDNSTVAASKTGLSQFKGSIGLSWPSGDGTPYIDGGIVVNSLNATGGGSVKPKEHSVTYIGRVGYRVIDGDLYSDFSVQVERDKSRLQFYVGRRF